MDFRYLRINLKGILLFLFENQWFLNELSDIGAKKRIKTSYEQESPAYAAYTSIDLRIYYVLDIKQI